MEELEKKDPHTRLLMIVGDKMEFVSEEEICKFYGNVICRCKECFGCPANPIQRGKE